MQGKALEQATKQHRTTKQALTKKQRQSKKSGEEFSQMDAQKLTLASKQHQDAQQQLDQVRKFQLCFLKRLWLVSPFVIFAYI